MTIVYVDFATTGLNVNYAEIVQIGARCGGHTFMRYVLPEYEIHPRATAVNGLHMRDGELCRRGETLPRVSSHYNALLGLVQFLDQCGQGETVALAAHNGFRLDFPILMRSADEWGLRQDLLQVAEHGIDTKYVFPREYWKWSLVDMAREHGVPDRDAHDALGDVDMMRRLCRELGYCDEDLWNVARHLDSFGF